MVFLKLSYINYICTFIEVIHIVSIPLPNSRDCYYVRAFCLCNYDALTNGLSIATLVVSNLLFLYLMSTEAFYSLITRLKYFDGCLIIKHPSSGASFINKRIQTFLQYKKVLRITLMEAINHLEIGTFCSVNAV